MSIILLTMKNLTNILIDIKITHYLKYSILSLSSAIVQRLHSNNKTHIMKLTHIF